MQAVITVESPVVESPRVQQVRGLFDLAPEKTSRLHWNVALPDRGTALEHRPRHRAVRLRQVHHRPPPLAARTLQSAALTWPRDRALLDAFPEAASIKDVTALLSAVGFSSPPAWLRPFHVLSTGQQFRVTLARLLAEALASPQNRSSSWTSTPASWTAPSPRSAAPPRRGPSAATDSASSP